MNIFTIFFYYKILAKNSPKRTILKKNSRGSMPQNPSSERVAYIATCCMAQSAMQIPTLLQKYSEPPEMKS